MPTRPLAPIASVKPAPEHLLISALVEGGELGVEVRAHAPGFELLVKARI